jgi:hypothetical protein
MRFPFVAASVIPEPFFTTASEFTTPTDYNKSNEIGLNIRLKVIVFDLL